MKLIIFGPPGAGKGTISSFISKEFKLNHISTGDLIRNEVKSNSELGERMNEIITTGNLLPDDMMLELLKKQLPKDNFILDGYPRNIEQAKELEKITNMDKIIFLVVAEEEIINRLTKRTQCSKCKKIYGKNFPPKDPKVCDICGEEVISRSDDNEEVIKHRIDVYDEQTLPLEDYYLDKMISIDANRKVELVLTDVKKALQ